MQAFGSPDDFTEYFQCSFGLHSPDYVTNLSARCGQAFKMHYDVTHGYHVRLMVAADISEKDLPPEFNVVRTTTDQQLRISCE